MSGQPLQYGRWVHWFSKEFWCFVAMPRPHSREVPVQFPIDCPTSLILFTTNDYTVHLPCHCMFSLLCLILLFYVHPSRDAVRL